jgi:hypothetical protein
LPFSSAALRFTASSDFSAAGIPIAGSKRVWRVVVLQLGAGVPELMKHAQEFFEELFEVFAAGWLARSRKP